MSDAAIRTCRKCGEGFVPTKSRRSYCGTCHSEYCRKRHQRVKREVFEAYGGLRCKCCGEETFEFLSLDHKHGGGNEHRRRVNQNLYSYLKRDGFPDREDYRVLCMNCNHAIGSYGSCPHAKD